MAVGTKSATLVEHIDAAHKLAEAVELAEHKVLAERIAAVAEHMVVVVAGHMAAVAVERMAAVVAALVVPARMVVVEFPFYNFHIPLPISAELARRRQQGFLSESCSIRGYP